MNDTLVDAKTIAHAMLVEARRAMQSNPIQSDQFCKLRDSLIRQMIDSDESLNEEERVFLLKFTLNDHSADMARMSEKMADSIRAYFNYLPEDTKD